MNPQTMDPLVAAEDIIVRERRTNHAAAKSQDSLEDTTEECLKPLKTIGRTPDGRSEYSWSRPCGIPSTTDC